MISWQNKTNINLTNDDVLIEFIDFSRVNNISTLVELLSNDEQEKANTLKIEAVYNQYVITRAMLRKALAQQLHCLTSELTIQYFEKGKPYLSNNDYYFNVSHTNAAAVIAISPNVTLGVDVENSQRSVDYDGVSTHVFTEREQDFITASSDKQRAFFKAWTRKEAFIKAHGAGMYSDLKAVSVTANNEQSIVEDTQLQQWFVTNLPDKHHYVMALATNVDAINLILFD